MAPETGNHPASDPAFSVHLIEERKDWNGFTWLRSDRCGTSSERYTPAMTLNKAAFLALVGMILATILLVGGFIGDVFNVVRGLIPAMRLLTSFIYAFAGLSVVMFLYAFHKAQS